MTLAWPGFPTRQHTAESGSKHRPGPRPQTRTERGLLRSPFSEQSPPQPSQAESRDERAEKPAGESASLVGQPGAPAAAGTEPWVGETRTGHHGGAVTGEEQGAQGMLQANPITAQRRPNLCNACWGNTGPQREAPNPHSTSPLPPESRKF